MDRMSRDDAFLVRNKMRSRYAIHISELGRTDIEDKPDEPPPASSFDEKDPPPKNDAVSPANVDIEPSDKW